MRLAIDIGNSNVKLGVWSGEAWAALWRLPTNRRQTADEYGPEIAALLRSEGLATAVDDVIFASGVPQLNAVIQTTSQRYIGVSARQVTATTIPGLAIRTDTPAEVGVDRLVNAVAAFDRHPGASLVVDLGTATTFDVVDADGAFLGGVIAAGLTVTADALARRAAQLGQVPLVAPPSVIGKNTVHAIQSGLIFGYASLVEGLISRLKRAVAPETPPVIATGGLVSVIAPHTSAFDIIAPNLTLDGLRLVAERQAAA